VSFSRTARVSSQVQRVVARIIAGEVKDPRVGGVNVTEVEISPDLREAKIYVVAPSDPSERAGIMEGLTKASGFIRRQLGREVRMRGTPNLTFRWDESIEYGARIEARLRELGLGGDPADEDPEDTGGSET